MNVNNKNIIIDDIYDFNRCDFISATIDNDFSDISECEKDEEIEL